MNGYEKGLISPFLQGREIKRYFIRNSNKIVIMPYKLSNGRAVLVQEKDIAKYYPKLLSYLTKNKHSLENREGGRMHGQNWYAYIYPKNIEVMKSKKILVPDIADRASFALDVEGNYAFTSGYGIVLRAEIRQSYYYVLGLLNSSLLDFFIRKVSTPLRGGFFRYFTQFVEQLPIKLIDFSSAVQKEYHDSVVHLVSQILAAKRANPAADVAALEAEIDAHVYRLYGLSEEEINVVEEATGKR